MARTRTHERVTRSAKSDSETGISLLGRIGLAGRTVFYAILTALAVRIALLGGTGGHQADANGALALVSRPLLGKAAIAAVALGFLMFGVARLLGAWKDHSVSVGRRWMTVGQGAFYLAMSYVPAAFLAGNRMTGSQQQQKKTTSELLVVPGGRWLVVVLGIILITVCVVQMRGAITQQFSDGLDLRGAPQLVRRLADKAGTIGITTRALVFLPIGIFLIIAGVESDAARSVGTDGELLTLARHTLGVAALAAVAAGLTVFVIFSAIETRYRQVLSAR